jgi:hypothetical protein
MTSSVRSTAWLRLHDIELLSIVREFATDFNPAASGRRPNQKGRDRALSGEQDMFCF